MKFGAVPVAEAEGAIAAHAVRLDGLALRKGQVLKPRDQAALQAAGVASLIAARLEPEDIGEDEAARRLADHLGGAHLRLEPPFTGRVNMFATANGLAIVDPPSIDRLNRVDEAITVATLAAYRPVMAGDMVATVKIIPFAVSGSALAATCEATGARGAIRVAPFRPLRLGVISTLLPGLKASVIAKTLRVMESRLAASNAIIVREERVAHSEAALASAIERLIPECEALVIFGASAITDRRDVIPAAIEASGGHVEHFGMPVDPGNLLLLARRGDTPILGAPGCARSPKENGFDWVLARILAGVPIAAADIQAMGVGGLLMEIATRRSRAAAMVEIAAIVLAAGRSTRFRAAGGSEVSKLVADFHGEPLVRPAVRAALASKARPVVVVTGHAREAVEAALADLPLTFAFNPLFATGLASSLKCGVAALPASSRGAVVLLGDMPEIETAAIDRLIEAFGARTDVLAAALLVEGRRGNPVLLGHELFEAVARLDGDEGARRLLGEADAARVVELALGDAGAAFDVDTPSDLEAARKRRI